MPAATRSSSGVGTTEVIAQNLLVLETGVPQRSAGQGVTLGPRKLVGAEGQQWAGGCHLHALRGARLPVAQPSLAGPEPVVGVASASPALSDS